MRGATMCGIGVAIAMGVAPSASAGVRADYKQTFTTSTPGRSTGTDTRILYKNPSDPKAKPIPVRREVFTFPAGTTYDESVVPDCTASDTQILLQGTSACPAASRLGGSIGDTGMTGFPGPDTAIDVDGWDQHGDLVLYGRDHQFGIGAVTRAVRKGQTVTVEVPRNPGGPPDGELALRRVHHVFPARSAGRRAYMRTPRKCPRSGFWKFSARFTFSDGVTENDAYRMRCKKPKPKPARERES
ncbi:MAG TPA: hypothetical protein VGC98_09735 [Thermoleophilaceae bacterium]